MNRADLLGAATEIKRRCHRLLRDSADLAVLLAEVQDVLPTGVNDIMEEFVKRRFQSIRSLVDHEQ